MSFESDTTIAVVSALLPEMGDVVSYIPRAGEPVSITVLWAEAEDQRYSAAAETLVSSLPSGYGKNDRIEQGSKVYRVVGFVSKSGELNELPRDSTGAVKLALRFAMETSA